MELSIFIAKIIGLTFTAMSIGAIFGGVSYKKMYLDIMKSPGLLSFSGLFAIILGFLLIKYHNIWIWDWPVIITIIGWMAIVEGVVYLSFPKAFKVFEPMFTGKFVKVFPYFSLAFGLLFAYLGFVAY